MPARTYAFTCGSVSFFSLDTGGCQFAVQRVEPDAPARLRSDIASLSTALAAADSSRPKIVFGHHALYTKSIGHIDEAKCLRLPSYFLRPLGEVEAVRRPGYGLEHVLVEGGASAYICGHEHVMQVRCVKCIHISWFKLFSPLNLVFQAHPSPTDGVPSFGVGATCETYFYKGEDKRAENADYWPSWVDPMREISSTGFAQVCFAVLFKK